MVNSKIQAAEENLIHVYNRFPIALDHGEGMYLYDTEGKEYLDFAAGFAVSGLGYDNKELNQALKDQIDKLYHTSNLYFHESCGEAARGFVISIPCIRPFPFLLTTQSSSSTSSSSFFVRYGAT